MIHDHAEEQMRAECQATAPDAADLLSPAHRAMPFGNRWRHQSQMAVNTNEAIMLNQEFQPAWAFSLDAHNGPGSDSPNRTANRRR
jgi:hypothetical protein